MLRNWLSNKGLAFRLQVTAFIILLCGFIFFVQVGFCQEEPRWFVHDVIFPALDSVRWFEEGSINAPADWIAGGMWVGASMRQSLVGESDIFVSTYEKIDWEAVRSYVGSLYGGSFGSFDEFNEALHDDPGLWLDLSWDIDAEWYGVVSDRIKVETSFDQVSSEAELWIWFHITRVPEYLVSDKKLESWLTGFEMTSISVGSLERWEFSEDWSSTMISYELRFEAPAYVLSQQGDNFTFRIDVSPYYEGYTFDVDQVIDVNMPVETEVKDAFPAGKFSSARNVATFLIERGDVYPESYVVVSGLPSKSLGQIFLESASNWALNPAGWAALGSIIVLSLTGLRGRVIWKRTKTYHRLYKSMVTLYDLYRGDRAKFTDELRTISLSVFKMMVADEITEDQFEKLLKLRDDLLDRVDKIEPLDS